MSLLSLFGETAEVKAHAQDIDDLIAGFQMTD
jgi:hypothetical protein